jgi:integrase/recombinase XerD
MEAVNPGNVKGLVDGFCGDCRLRGMTEESTRRYRGSLLIFAEFLERNGGGGYQIDMNTLKGFLQYVRNEREASFGTIENFFSALSAFYDYLIFEGLVSTNIVLPFRKRYLRRYKEDYDDPERKLLSVEEMSRLVNSIMDPRDKAVAVLLAKTGIRRGEMLKLDVDDIRWEDCSIKLKPTPKRSNRVVFFDDECAIVLKRWLKIRDKLNPKTNALFVSYQNLLRLSRNAAWEAVVKYARRLGFHKPESPELEDHFGPHCFRHWFTTWLRRNGMPREFIQELRGDKRREAIDIYDHIDHAELRKMYLACIPKLGI